MKNCILIIVGVAAFVLLGCAAKVPKDPVDQVVQKLSGNEFFKNGYVKFIFLPTNAPLSEIVEQACYNSPEFHDNVPRVNILTNRQVTIFGMPYIAVLVDSGNSRKVVLLQCLPNNRGWWNRVYDVN